MPRIRIILEDDVLGNAIKGEQPRVYELGSGLERLREIETAVEHFKQAALPDLESELLEVAQERFVQQRKKGPTTSSRRTSKVQRAPKGQEEEVAR